MNGTFPLSGNIDAKAFPFLVMDLHHHGATGSLKVDGPTYQKALYFRGGRILFGSSNDPRDQLGAILIDAGKLTPEQLEEVNAKVGPGNPLAKVLTDSGLVTQQELSEAAKAKVERILGDVLAYSEGSFEFEDGVLPKGAVDLKLNTERLILGAVRQIGDRSFVLGHLGSLEVVLSPAGGLDAKVAEMEADARGLAAEMDGAKTLKDAIARTRLEEFDGAKIACGLLLLGLLKPVGGAPATRAPRGTEEDSPFFVADGGGQPELDLGATARMALSAPSEDRAPTVPVLAPPPVHEAPSLRLPVDGPATPLQPISPPPVVPSAPVAPPPASFPFLAAEPPIPVAPILEPGTTESLPSRAPTIARVAAQDEPSVFPTIEPPSKRDLAALDALLSPRQSPPGPLSAPPRGSLPDFARPQYGGRARRSSGGGIGKAWLFLLTLVLLSAAGGAGWWWFYARQAPLREPAVATSPTPAPTPLPPPNLAPQVVDNGATPEATPAPAAPTAPPVAPVPTPALATPAVLPATPAPLAQSAGEPRALLSAGRFADAARAYAARAQAVRTRLTVQILVACSDETVQKALQSVPSEELYIVPVVLKGRACYRLCWGSYASAPLAEDALRRLPDYFRQGGARPRVVPVATILP